MSIQRSGPYRGTGPGEPDHTDKSHEVRPYFDPVTDGIKQGRGYATDIIFINEEIRDTDVHFSSGAAAVREVGSGTGGGDDGDDDITSSALRDIGL